MTPRDRIAAAALFVVASLVACTPTATVRKLRVLDDPRVSMDDDAVSTYAPDSKLFRIAVVDFVDQTNNYAGKVEDMFADVLTTELYKTSRFTLYDRNQLKRKNISTSSQQAVGVAVPANMMQGQVNQNGMPVVSTNGQPVSGSPTVTASSSTGRLNDEGQVENEAQRLRTEVDGVFLGFVTNAEIANDQRSGVYTIDYRIVKNVGSGLDAAHAAGSHNGATGGASTLVIFADSDRVRFTGNPMQLQAANVNAPIALNRDDLARIADKVRKFFPDLQVSMFRTARVTDINGRTLSINLGSAEIKPGFSFFVTTEPDDATGEFYYKGKFIVRDTFDRASRATLSEELDDSYMRSIKVGDRIVFK
ncbi:MAG: hypothetical protein JST54_13180 [Deltaproteobacteria bacterium]|nr:hypothetical protein [Deltaproteobacteria bacterium]